MRHSAVSHQEAAMKKFLKIAAISVVGLLLILLVAAYLLLNRGVKAAVETVGPQMTKTTVRLGSVSLWPFSGSGTVGGFAVGNPEGFKGAQAVGVKSASVALKVSSVLSDPVIIESLHIDGAELDYESGPGGSNLERIVKNIEDYCGTAESKSTRKVIIKDLRIANARVRVSPALLLGQSVPVSVPDIHLTGIGEKSNGETLGDAMKEIMAPLSKGLSGPLGEVGNTIKDLGGKTMRKGLDSFKGVLGK
jgi:hypothetical protein